MANFIPLILNGASEQTAKLWLNAGHITMIEPSNGGSLISTDNRNASILGYGGEVQIVQTPDQVQALCEARQFEKEGETRLPHSGGCPKIKVDNVFAIRDLREKDGIFQVFMMNGDLFNAPDIENLIPSQTQTGIDFSVASNPTVATRLADRAYQEMKTPPQPAQQLDLKF